ncbi:hypothetical protein AB0J90_03905 [Micromonospora sp. NPDC049523]|uniref:hypothetical protein n=1 Tax=Micromonospora sp. NPDC049523 TaxID=3155921 RepID=UPI003442789D
MTTDEVTAGDRTAGSATVPEQPVGPPRGHAVSQRLVRLLRHEWTLASLGGLLLAVLLTWPTLRDVTTTIPQDTGDPVLQAWQVAWGGHALLTDPIQLWHSNTFFPERYTYAYSDTLLGYAPLGMVGEGPVAAIVRYNILYVLVHALAFVGAYALVRQLGANRIGAALAGVAYGYAPWKLAQAGHLHVLSIGGIALALAMLARGHGWSLTYGYRPELRRPGWALAGWLVAAWQMTLGFGIGLPFGYALAVLCLVVVVGYLWSWWRRSARPVFGRRLLTADLVGGVVFAAITLAMALPYLKVVEQNPDGRRTLAHLEQFSPPLRGFFTAPPESWLWGERHAAARELLPFAGEMTLLPGVVLIGLAFAGLFFSAWRVRHRVLLAAGVLVSVALAAGTSFGGDGNPGYATLFLHLPGWDAIRTPGRLILWTTLLLGILAAGVLSMLGRTEPSDASPGDADGRTSATDGSGATPATDGSGATPATGGIDGGATSATGGIDGDASATGGSGAAATDGDAADGDGGRPAADDEPAPAGGAAVPARSPVPVGAGVTSAFIRPAVPVAHSVSPPPKQVRASGPARPMAGWVVRLLTLVPLALVVLEGVNTTPHAPVQAQPAALRGMEGPLLVLPSDGTFEFTIMLWSTDGFPKIANGLASFVPPTQQQIRAVTPSFPDQTSVAYLRQIGIRTVVVLPEYVNGTPWQDVLNRDAQGLGISREDIAGAVVFRLG